MESWDLRSESPVAGAIVGMICALLCVKERWTCEKAAAMLVRMIQESWFDAL